MSMFRMTREAAQALYEGLEELFEAVPTQSKADWWPDELTKAMQKAKLLLEDYGE